MPFGDLRIKRLTAPAMATEDAEKTAVFHYSKVKQVTPDAPLFDQTCLTECNIITSHSLSTVFGVCQARPAEGNGTV
jgi:hypothetical protein